MIQLSLDVSDNLDFKLAVKIDGEQRHLISQSYVSHVGKASSISKVFDISLRTGQNLDILVIESSYAYKNAGKFLLTKSNKKSHHLILKLITIFRSLFNI